MPTARSPIARAIAELETERAHLLARVEKVDTAIAAIRDAFHLPAVTERPARTSRVKDTPARKPSQRRQSSRHGNAEISDQDVRAFLQRGPIAPAPFYDHFKLSKHAGRQVLKQLAASGLVRVTGTTVSRRIALAGAPAKEAL